MRKKRILLGLVESVNFVDEHDGPRTVLLGALRIGHDLLDFFDPRQHRRKLNKVRLSHAGDDFRERSFARSGRPPKNQRSRIVPLNLRAQWLSRTYKMLLPQELIQRSRTHPVRQWTRGVAALVSARNGLEKAHSRSTQHSAVSTQSPSFLSPQGAVF